MKMAYLGVHIGRLENSDLNDFAHRPLILPRANTGLLI
jgi:hypothetical protein